MNISPLEAWYEALASKLGIVISVDDPQLFIQRMYKARKEAGDPQLDGLSILASPINPAEIWVLKNGKNS